MRPGQLIPRISDTVATCSLLVLAPICAWVLLYIPRPVAPTEMPELILPTGEIVQIIKQDSIDASRAPNSEAALELEKLILDKGESEQKPTEPLYIFKRREEKFQKALERVRSTHGEKGIIALRARAVDKLEQALDLQLTPELTQQVLGAFPVFLARYHAAIDGVLVAPRFVIRTMYKARWNMITGLDSTYKFARAERQAHYGWLAFKGQNAPLELRLQALNAYAAAGGKRISEAMGVLLFQAGNYPLAVTHLQKAHAQSGSMRIRNYLIGARMAAREASPQ